MSDKPQFSDAYTTNVVEATEILFEKAIYSVPEVPYSTVSNAFETLKRSWGSTGLVEGNKEKVKKYIFANLKTLSQESGFRQFKVTTYGNNSAQISIITAKGFKAVRVWRCENKYIACGDEYFKKKKWWQFWK